MKNLQTKIITYFILNEHRPIRSIVPENVAMMIIFGTAFFSCFTAIRTRLARCPVVVTACYS